MTDGSGYKLNVQANDSYSGVQSIQVLVDGERGATPYQGDCSTGTCPNSPPTYDFTFRPERFAAGDHSIRVIVRDKLNHTFIDSWTVRVTHAARAELEPGSVNLLTGSMRVSREDVLIDSFKSPLTMSRVHNSTDETAGATGAFGPGWLAGLPAWGADADYVQLTPSVLTPAPNPKVDTSNIEGFIDVLTIDGDEIGFDQNGDGTFGKPIGYEDLSLTYDSGADRFTLSDTSGNTTVFRNDGTGTYRPFEVRQANDSSATTYYYNDTGQIDRVLAPTPAGVTSCSPMTAGCRALMFTYAPSDTANPAAGQFGDYPARLKQIDFVAGTNAPGTVARYSYDSDGRLHAAWDPRISPALTEAYAYDAAGHVTAVTPPGEQPWTMSFAAIEGDSNTGRLSTVSRYDPALGQTATWKMAYKVPRTGAGAPYEMTSGSAAAWGQTTSLPVEATAVIPPDGAAGSYARATVHYMDEFGRGVNVARPGSRISTTEYDARDNVTRELTAANRARALAGGGDTAARATELSTKRVYSSDGIDLVDEYGPSHSIRRADRTVLTARKHTHIDYDQGKPDAEKYHLATTTTVTIGDTGSDARVTKTAYEGQGNLGWKLRKPTSITVDAGSGGLALKTTMLYDPVSGLQTERRLPENPNGGTAASRKTIYYSVGAQSGEAAPCGSKAEWANLPCKTLPAAQPATAPALPVATYEYNSLNQVTKLTETTGSATRTTTTGYDGAGRKTTETVSASESTALNTVTYAYATSSGRLLTTTRTQDGATRTITRTYDGWGRVIGYADADGSTATTSYDLRGRVASTTDGKGEQTRTYDAITGDLTTLQDSGLGTITADYDADGELVRQALPNGVIVQNTYDETGSHVRRTYAKGGTTLFDDTITESVHGQWIDHVSSASRQDYTYDGAGRLTRVSDTRAGQCTVRDYAYDPNSNRERQTVHPPAFLLGTCEPNSAGTVTSYTNDTADRMTDGEQYDAFGRTTLVPAAHAGGAELISNYFADDTVRSVKQAGIEHTYQLDPEGRGRVDEAKVTTTTGGVLGVGGTETTTTTTATNHYGDDSDEPTWVAEDATGMQWTRNVPGADGDLVAIQTQAATKVQITNLHGDVVATATNDSNATMSAVRESTEFGVPAGANSSARYQWLGAKQRESALPTGMILMGARVYNPVLGRFLQVDPIEGGSLNDYEYAGQDPVNMYDLDGRCFGPLSKACAGGARLIGRGARGAWKGAKKAFGTARKIRFTRPRIERHGGGPHQHWHFQVEVYVKGRRKSHRTLRFPPHPVKLKFW